MQVATFLQDDVMYKGLILEVSGVIVVRARVMLPESGRYRWWRRCHIIPEHKDCVLASGEGEGATESSDGADVLEVRAFINRYVHAAAGMPVAGCRRPQSPRFL